MKFWNTHAARAQDTAEPADMEDESAAEEASETAELIEIRHGETGVTLDDVSGMELAGLAILAGAAILGIRAWRRGRAE